MLHLHSRHLLWSFARNLHQCPSLHQVTKIVSLEKWIDVDRTLATQVITKTLPPIPPPPRSVIIEKLPPLPAKPPDVLIERWIPYEATTKRKVIVERAEQPEAYPPPKNVIITSVALSRTTPWVSSFWLSNLQGTIKSRHVLFGNLNDSAWPWKIRRDIPYAMLIHCSIPISYWRKPSSWGSRKIS